MKEIHAHGGLMNHLEFLSPHQSVTDQEIVQRSIAHVLHHHSSRFSTQSIDGDNVLEFHVVYFGCLIYYSPVIENVVSKSAPEIK